jgi:C-terminal processing protease CtpA/Prc
VTLEATLTAGQASQARDWIAYASNAPEPPLYRRDMQKNWLTYLEKDGVAYFAFNRYEDDKSLHAFSEELEQFLRDKQPRRLVVDLRNNPGGDFGLGRWYIIRAVMRFSHLLTRGRLFVATDRSSFSAAFINALDFRRDANAILVGEPPGERP